MRKAKPQGVSLVGRGGLLNQLTKTVLETALEAELTEHLGDERGHSVGSNAEWEPGDDGLTQIGPVQIEVPRDPDRFFDPVIVPKRKPCLEADDRIVLSPIGGNPR